MLLASISMTSCDMQGCDPKAFNPSNPARADLNQIEAMEGIDRKPLIIKFFTAVFLIATDCRLSL